MPQAAIFDIDGTLVDFVDLHVSGRNHRREVCYGSLVLNDQHSCELLTLVERRCPRAALE